MIGSIDHIVLTTGNLERCLDFYTRVLGMRLERYGANRLASHRDLRKGVSFDFV